ncbi:predicted protein [Scheffersomyces stipitis CBS 6054]|uniref:Sfi1 spindle body domain-containing protein n=1 Tax=Scheffersomyces stipitis (strain ATCC 58785 / CBS 6054 / NBRC 10063 / NRRL Y-11545) TaxID=322104 RepID=A3LSM3_PICST|nr:predicted protein [Scheffersomyces stipitis CBS 6054]ABN65927.2 predicted protein [Scheffersomyces stipitis CBS 6054]
MSISSLKDLLHTTLRELHALHSYSALPNAYNYESRLQQTITDVFHLLDYDSDKICTSFDIRVSSSVSNIGSISMLAYTNRHLRNETSSLSFINVLDYVRRYNVQDNPSESNALDQLVRLLVLSEDRRPTRIKDSYSAVIVEFSHLVEQLISLNSDCEAQLASYLCNCYLYDLKYFNDLQHKLDVNLNNDDTEQLVNILDEYVNHSQDEKLQGQDENDSIFIYDDSDIAPLGFSCTDSNLQWAYHTFLNVLASKENPRRHVKQYVKVMINLCKKHSGIAYFGINSTAYRQSKFAAFRQFFSSLLPAEFQIINERAIAAVEKTFADHPQSSNDSQQSSETTRAVQTENEAVASVDFLQPFAKEDRLKLYRNLDHIIPLLNEFNLSFDSSYPAILKYYMIVAYDELPTLVVPYDFEYMEQVVAVVNRIVDFENEDDDSNAVSIKDNVLKLNTLHHYLSPKNIMNQPATLLMRISVLEFSKRMQSKKIVLECWRDRYYSLSQLDSLMHKHQSKFEDRLSERYLRSWYGKGLKYYRLDQEAETYYLQSIVDKHFYNWKMTMNTSIQNDYAADIYFQRKFFKIFQGRLIRVHEALLTKLATEKRETYQTYFRKFQKRHQRAEELIKISIAKNDEFVRINSSMILRHFFQQWHSRVNEINMSESSPDNLLGLGTKLKKLGAIEQMFILKLHWKTWKRKHDLQRRFNSVKVANDMILLKFIIRDTWLKETRLSLTGKEVLNEKYRTLKLLYFHFWIEQVRNAGSMFSFKREKLLKRYFSKWKNERLDHHSLRIYAGKRNTSILKSYFVHWNRVYNLSLFQSKSQDLLKRRMFVSWHQKWITNKISQTNSSKLTEQRLLQTVLSRWRQRIGVNSKLNEKADEFVKLKFWKVYTGRRNRSSCQLLEAELFNNKLSFQNCFLLRAGFTFWKESWRRNFDEKSQRKIQMFQDTTIIPHLKRRMIVCWVSKYNKQLEVNKILESRLDESYSIGPLVQRAFDSWSSNLISKQNLFQDADDLNRKLLLKKSMIIWYNEYLNKTVYLDEVANEFYDNREFEKIRSILSNWSMKYIKTIKRNEQSCDLFIQRWENVHLKTILDLWIYKMREMKMDISSQEVSSFDLSNSSFISTSSPLAKRSFPRSSPVKKDAAESYFNTPLKMQFSKSTVLTPSRISPTKLQETTQRLKNEKIDAYRKHFGRAKGSSPKTSPNRNRSYVTSRSFISAEDSILDSSKIMSRSRYSRILPPDPPIFSSGTEVEVYSDQSSSEETQKVTVETAKQLRRITPIMFPTDNDLPIFSPESRLKARLSQHLGNI